MNLSGKINKIKIILFGNIWAVRTTKIIRYLSVILVAWLVGRSENLFPGIVTPWTVFVGTLRWGDKTLEQWLSGFFSLSFFTLLIFAYFWLSGILVEWLTRIKISPHQQIKIIEKKTYVLDEKLSYRIEKINNLEATVFRGSPYVSLSGSLLLLSNGKEKKTINFICYSHSNIIDPYLSPSNLETYFPQTKLEFKQKSFFTWQKIIGIIVLVAGSGFICQIYKDGGTYHDQKLGPIVKSKGAIQEQIAKESKKKTEEEEKQQKLKEAKITAPEDIKKGFESIGGLAEAKKQCENNAEIIIKKNKDPNSLNEPQHMLLYGPPGTGKTFLAQSIAKKSGSFFLNLNGKDFKTTLAQAFGNEKGISSEDKIKRTFDIAIQLAEGKTIVALIDEIDQMGDGWGSSGKELLSILSGATSDRYKNIVIIATTNNIEKLSGALLRSERLSRKLLINYPGPKDLLSITNKVASEFYDEIKPKKGGSEALGSQSKDAFKSKFGKLMYEEMNKNNYTMTVKDIFGEDLPEKINPDERRALFTGADVKNAFFEALRVMGELGQKTLNKKHVAEAVKRVYQDNRANPHWLFFVREFVRLDYIKELDQEDARKMKGKRPQEF